MAKISLSDGFAPIPEGINVFKITEVIYKEDFGKLEVCMETASGQKHTERFNLVSADGNPCEGAINSFSFFAKTALNDYTLAEIDHTDLVGHYIECRVIHEKVASNKDPNRTVTFARLTDKYPADGFVQTKISEKTKDTPTPTASKSTKINLDDLLG